jgi:hypothetical protein
LLSLSPSCSSSSFSYPSPWCNFPVLSPQSPHHNCQNHHNDQISRWKKMLLPGDYTNYFLHYPEECLIHRIALDYIEAEKNSHDLMM